ncbi:MAG: hypothetical protein ABUL72_05985 [Armatimonadota bacterium]
MKSLSLLFVVLGALALAGCGEPPAPKPDAADKVAAEDPDAKARQLLKDFAAAEDQTAWVQTNTFALSVFQNVKDPQVKAEFQSKIAPLMGASK